MEDRRCDICNQHVSDLGRACWTCGEDFTCEACALDHDFGCLSPMCQRCKDSESGELDGSEEEAPQG